MDVTVTCPCLGAPHPDGDTVTLRDKPSLHMGTTALGWASQQANGNQPTTGDIAELYLREGILSWTFLDEDGSAKVVGNDALNWLLDDYELSYPIADAAASLYTDAIFRPLVAQLNKSPSPTARRRPSSKPGPTNS